MQHASGSDTVEVGKKWREKLHFNHGTLSADTIRDQWHFPLLKEFILLCDLETSSLNFVMFSPRCVFQGDAACAPQHRAVLVRMLISFNGSDCLFLSWTGSFEPDVYLNDSSSHLFQSELKLKGSRLHYPSLWRISVFLVWQFCSYLPPPNLRCTLIITGSAVSYNTQWAFNYPAWRNKQIVHIICFTLISTYFCRDSLWNPMMVFVFVFQRFSNLPVCLHLSIYVPDKWEHKNIIVKSVWQVTFWWRKISGAGTSRVYLVLMATKHEMTSVSAILWRSRSPFAICGYSSWAHWEVDNC